MIRLAIARVDWIMKAAFAAPHASPAFAVLVPALSDAVPSLPASRPAAPKVKAGRFEAKYGGGTIRAAATMGAGDPDSRPDAERMTALLASLAATTDEAVFAELFRFYAPRLKSYMRKLGAPEDQAEELAQEAMATVWRKAHLFDAAKAGAGTWIFSIARNLRIDAFRRRKRPEAELDDLALVPDDPVSPETALDQGQQAAAVRAALAALPDEQAKIVRLSFYEDKPHVEIAAELGIPLGTVKSRMRLAFNRFRRALGEPEEP